MGVGNEKPRYFPIPQEIEEAENQIPASLS
jgi:hypothetical protein